MRVADTWLNGSQIRIKGLPSAAVIDWQFIFPKLTLPCSLPFWSTPESLFCLSTTKHVLLGFSPPLQGPKSAFARVLLCEVMQKHFCGGLKNTSCCVWFLTHYCWCPCRDDFRTRPSVQSPLIGVVLNVTVLII